MRLENILKFLFKAPKHGNPDILGISVTKENHVLGPFQRITGLFGQNC